MGLGNPDCEGHFTDPVALQTLKDGIPLTADGRAVHYVELFVAMCRNAYQFDPHVTHWTGTEQPQEVALKQFSVDVAVAYPSIYAANPTNLEKELTALRIMTLDALVLVSIGGGGSTVCRDCCPRCSWCSFDCALVCGAHA